MGRIVGSFVFSAFLAGAAMADAPAEATAQPRVVGAFCTAPGCGSAGPASLAQGAAFGAAALGVLWMRGRRD